jgi:hypothetical protein
MITFLASPYHTAGRGGAKITDIVVHWMDGTLAATDAEFTHGSRRVSAHYGIEDATIHQYVHDADTAWHAGNWNENTRSIGIEHSAQPGRDATPATIATSVALMATLCRQYGIDPSRIFPHSKFYATQCPGTLPIVAMIAAVRAQLANPQQEDDMLTPEAQTWIEGRLDAHDAFVLANLKATIGRDVTALRAQVDPAALAKAVAAAMPATGGVTQAELEAALRTVLGSVDNTP